MNLQFKRILPDQVDDHVVEGWDVIAAEPFAGGTEWSVLVCRTAPDDAADRALYGLVIDLGEAGA